MPLTVLLIVRIGGHGGSLGVAVRVAVTVRVSVTVGVAVTVPVSVGVALGEAVGVTAWLQPPMVSNPDSVTAPAEVANARPCRLTGNGVVRCRG